MRLIIATRNMDKVREIKEVLEGTGVQILSLHDFPEIKIPGECGVSFGENAMMKARAVARHFENDFVLADDSGLSVDALKGEPGLRSSRYAGEEGNYAKNNEKLLKEMEGVGKGERGAEFVCAIALIGPGGLYKEVEGRCRGEIAFEQRGKGGFGYDPLFFIPERGKTFAELSPREKNEISHRGKALREIKRVLLEITGGKIG